MFSVVIVLCFLIVSSYALFMPSKSMSRMVTSKAMTPIEVASNLPVVESVNTLVGMNQGLLLADAELPTQLFAFLFVSAAIMGSLQDFLKAFDKK